MNLTSYRLVNLTSVQESILNEYFANEEAKIKNLVKKIIRPFGNIAPYEYDDFYDIANEHILDALLTWNPDRCPFEPYFNFILTRKIKTEITRRNRIKRTADRTSISVESLTEKGEGKDTYELVDDMDLERELCDREYSLGFREYLSRLPKRAKQILSLTDMGYKPSRIKEILKISDGTYANMMNIIKDPDNIMLLFREDESYVNTYER